MSFSHYKKKDVDSVGRLVELGCSYTRTSKITGIPRGTIAHWAREHGFKYNPDASVVLKNGWGGNVK